MSPIESTTDTDMIKGLHPVTWLILGAIALWFASDAILLAVTVLGSSPQGQSPTHTLSVTHVLGHFRKEAPQVVLNITGAVVVECLARVWQDLRGHPLDELENAP